MENKLSFRERYNRRISLAALIFLALHIPVFLLVALKFETEIWVALGLSTGLLALGVAAFYVAPTSVFTLNVLAVVAIGFSGILIHQARGMIEMHFHIFVILGILPLFGYLTPLILAAGTAAVHHLGLFFLLPSSVFNYQASIEIVLLHAAFVVLQTGLCLFIAAKFKAFVQAQNDFIPQLTSWAQDLRGSGQAIRSNSLQLTEQSNQQNQGVVECESSLRSLVQTVANNEKSSQMTYQFSEEAQILSQETEERVKGMAGAIESLREGTKKIQHLSEMVGQIREKTELIDDIVFQTKLLSFNASVEAERAGEQGRGFAVVAQEVGNLARVSGQSASEITGIVHAAVKEAEKVTLENKQLVENWQNNTRASLESVQKMAELMAKLLRVSEEVKASSQTQRQEVEQINQSVVQLKHSSEQTEVQVNDLASTSQQIAAFAEQMDESLKLLVKTLGEQSMDLSQNSQSLHFESGAKAAPVSRKAA